MYLTPISYIGRISWVWAVHIKFPRVREKKGRGANEKRTKIILTLDSAICTEAGTLDVATLFTRGGVKCYVEKQMASW